MEGSKPRPSLHFNGHFDVVPVGDGWTVDPFGALIRDGKLYGRGVSDQEGLGLQLRSLRLRRFGVPG